MTALRRTTDTTLGDPRIAPSEQADASRAELAGYIAQMTGQMAAMARGEKLDLLAYFLDMARIEAASQAELDRAA